MSSNQLTLDLANWVYDRPQGCNLMPFYFVHPYTQAEIRAEADRLMIDGWFLTSGQTWYPVPHHMETIMEWLNTNQE